MTDIPPPSMKKIFGTGVFWSSVNQGIHQVLVLAVFLVTARFISVEAFGVMAICLLIVEAFRQILADSVATYIYAKKNPTPSDYNAGFMIILVGSVLAALFIPLISGPVSSVLDQPEITLVLPWLSILLLTAGLSKMHEAWLIKQYKFRTLAFRSLASITLGGAVGIYMAVHGYGIYSLIAQQIVMATSSLVFLWFGAQWRPGLSFTRGDVFTILRYSRFTSATSVITFLHTQSDTFFASYYLGTAATGIYNTAKRLITAVSAVLSNGFSNVALPMFADMRSSDASRAARAFLKCTCFSVMLAAPFFLGLSAMADDAVAILLGDKWKDVGPVLALLSIAAFIGLLGRYNTGIFLTHEKPMWQTALISIEMIANIVILALTARHGLIVMAAAYVIKCLVFFPLNLHLALRLLKLPVKSYLRAVWPSLVAALLMAAAVQWLGHYPLADFSPWIRTLMLLPAGATLYAGLLYLFDRKNVVELFQTIVHVART